MSYGEEMYDHSIDPGEMMNLAARAPFSEFKSQLRELLKEKLAAAGADD